MFTSAALVLFCDFLCDFAKTSILANKFISKVFTEKVERKKIIDTENELLICESKMFNSKGHPST